MTKPSLPSLILLDVVMSDSTMKNCSIKKEIDFFEETYTTRGCKPAQSKATAITEMPAPSCKKQVQSFIGMVCYLSKFSTHLSELAEPIRELSKEKVPFNWGPEHQEAFQLMKKEIAATAILAYYNPRIIACLETVASIKGLGACLLQDHKPKYFASKALTEVQRGYVAIELESLAVGWQWKNSTTSIYQYFFLETDLPLSFYMRYIPGLTNQLPNFLYILGGQEIPSNF